MTLPNDIDSYKLLDTVVYAAEKHKYQHRKGQLKIPYINHPLKVAHLLMHITKQTDPVLIQAAILHDTLEDTPATYNELADTFGTGVATVVQEVTDDMTLPQQERKKIQIENAAKLSDRARLIRIADKICNLKDIIEYPPLWPKSRKIKYALWAKEVVNACGETHAELEKYFEQVYNECMQNLQ
ncbi:MAG: HD domain-containing protein [Bacteroidetes bacterium]|jgi:guanosine-3',5'-bis(diphosphate) 3'-pyrophosphohydrolase|nr:HD domain-containing protein [Bacteroidota bacterium]